MSDPYRPAVGKLLTPTQTEVMVRVLDGQTVNEIALAIAKSPSTISTHLARAKGKLGAKTVEQAAVFFDRQRRAQ